MSQHESSVSAWRTIRNRYEKNQILFANCITFHCYNREKMSSFLSNSHQINFCADNFVFILALLKWILPPQISNYVYDIFLQNSYWYTLEILIFTVNQFKHLKVLLNSRKYILFSFVWVVIWSQQQILVLLHERKSINVNIWQGETSRKGTQLSQSLKFISSRRF